MKKILSGSIFGGLAATAYGVVIGWNTPITLCCGGHLDLHPCVNATFLGIVYAVTFGVPASIAGAFLGWGLDIAVKGEQIRDLSESEAVT